MEQKAKNKLKAAVAAGSAAFLLMGGIGSVAYWTSDATAPGVTVNAGDIQLGSMNCGTGWAFDDAEGSGSFDPDTGFLVPGDVITKECTSTIIAKGDHLRADLGVTGAGKSGTLADALDVDADFEVNGSAASSITDANDGQTLSATITITFDPAADNTTKNTTATITDFVVTATQDHY